MPVPLSDLQGLPDDIARLWSLQWQKNKCVKDSHGSGDAHPYCLLSCFTKVHCGVCFLFEMLGYWKENNC